MGVYSDVGILMQPFAYNEYFKPLVFDKLRRDDFDCPDYFKKRIVEETREGNFYIHFDGVKWYYDLNEVKLFNDCMRELDELRGDDTIGFWYKFIQAQDQYDGYIQDVYVRTNKTDIPADRLRDYALNQCHEFDSFFPFVRFNTPIIKDNNQEEN